MKDHSKGWERLDGGFWGVVAVNITRLAAPLVHSVAVAARRSGGVLSVCETYSSLKGDITARYAYRRYGCPYRR